MMTTQKNQQQIPQYIHKQYLRVYKTLLALSFIAETISLIYYGIILFPGGNIYYKILWCICSGVAAAAIIGMLIILFIFNRFQGIKAILLTILLGMIAVESISFVCLMIDQNLHYFGGDKNPLAFLAKDFIDGIIATILIGYLIFTKNGNKFLDKIGF